MPFDLASIRAQHRKQARDFVRDANRQDVAKRAKALRRQQDQAALHEVLDYAVRAGLSSVKVR
jgi:hypothetical protein